MALFHPRKCFAEMPDAILSARAVYRGWLNLLLVSLTLNGSKEERPLIEHPSGSAVLAYDPARRVALTISETRLAPLYLGKAPPIEAPGGVIDDDDAAQTARREAFEEAGVELLGVEKVATVWVNPSTSTERVHLYLAQYSLRRRVAEGGGLTEENEEVRVQETSLDELWSALTCGGLVDAKTLLLVQALRIHRPDLFS
jgi:8-oxo-dGTP pyrophosphatase MutT (NUDIX family)